MKSDLYIEITTPALSLPSQRDRTMAHSILTVVNDLSCVWAVVVSSVCVLEVGLFSVKHVVYCLFTSPQFVEGNLVQNSDDAFWTRLIYH